MATRDQTIYIRCTEKEKKALQKAADQESRSLSNYIVVSALEAAEEAA